MSKTNASAFMLCPRKCDQCEDQDHCWGEYDADALQCKHCPAQIDYSEKCENCQHELVVHMGDNFQCEEIDDDDENEVCDCKTFKLTKTPKKRSVQRRK